MAAILSRPHCVKNIAPTRWRNDASTVLVSSQVPSRYQNQYSLSVNKIFKNTFPQPIAMEITLT